MNFLRISFLLLLFLFQVATAGFAQNVNWRRATPENKHLVYTSLGFTFGTVAAAGYGYRLHTALPILLSTEFSAPFGNHIFDDFKTKLGGQAEVLHVGNFSATVKVAGVFRRFESNYARLLNFGSETGAVIGFYKHKWYVAAECSFDKAITTHVRHSAIMETYYPDIQDGWYIPTGGNFFYGLQSGFSAGKNDFHLSVGKSVTQDFKTRPLPPLYCQLGYNRRF